MSPFTSFKNVAGVTSLKWSSPDTIMCGGNDHQIKVFSVQKQTVQESIFTNHKAVTALETTTAEQILAG